MHAADEDLSATPCNAISCLPECYFEEETEYEMRYTAGTSMWDFWLSELKFVKSLEWWRNRMTSKVLSFELQEAKEIHTNCILVALLPSGVAIRAKVLAETAEDEFGNYYPFLLDIDTGEIMRIYVDTLYIPDEEIMKKKPFAVNCCLGIGKNSFNRTFLQNISNDVVKVLFKRVTLSSPPKFVVSVQIKRKGTYINIVNTLNADKKLQETDTDARNITDIDEKKVFKFEGFSKDGKTENQDGTKVILDVQVSHLDSISRFYIWESLDHLKQLRKLMAEMNAFYKSTFVDVCEKFYESLSPGDCCAALDMKELNWYRAQILNHSRTEDFKGLVQKHYEVLFVDFGSRMEVPCSLLRPLKAEFFIESAFAKCCHLFGVKPAPGFESADGLDFSENIIDIFGGFLESGRLTVIEAPHSENDPPGSIPVILERNYKGNDYVINLELLGQRLVSSTVLDVNACKKVFESAESGSVNLSNFKKTAVKTEEVVAEEKETSKELSTSDNIVSILSEPSLSKSSATDFAGWNPMEDDYASNEITYENLVNDDASAMIGYQATDEGRICKFFAASGHCYKGASCKKEHKYIRPDGITTDCQLVPGKAFSYLALPKPGSQIKLHVMFVADVIRFYAVLLDAWKYKETSNLPNEKFPDDTLDNLIDHINSKENISKLKRLTMPPGVGEIVLCKMQSVNSYYRAQVLDTNLEDNEFEVLFVDVGMTEWVNVRNLRQIENEYLHLPFQAVDCDLARCGLPQDTDGHRKIQVMRKLSSMISFKVLNANVVRSFTAINKLVVELYDESGASVGDKLKELGYFVEVRDIYENCHGILPG